MTPLIRLLAIVGLLLGVAAGAMPFAYAGQPSDTMFDIANVPLPVQALPEDGYQVLAGGYLDLQAASTWIAQSRMRTTATMQRELEDAGWVQTYVLDLVLLEDRAFAPSDILALVQTNVHLMPDTDGAERVFSIMADFSRSDDAESVEPAVNNGVTVSLRSQSGDTMRTLFWQERAVVEVVTLEGLGFVDPETHRSVAIRTLDRLTALQAEGEPAIATRAVRLAGTEGLADLQDFQQSGVHHLYRVRDGATQPAAGEVMAPSPMEIADGLEALYLGSEAMRFGTSGTGYLSTWIGEFASDASALEFVATITAGEPSAALFDPYFRIAAGERALWQGVAGIYQVRGVLDGQAYSGWLEVRQEGPYVVAIGFRTLGRVLPPVDVTSQMMDHQLICLDMDIACPPIDIDGPLDASLVTPAMSGDAQGVWTSAEFGWSVRTDSGGWAVTGQFTEPGYDFLELQSGRSLVTFESVINQHGDTVQCVIDELDALQEFESNAVIELGDDFPEEAHAGSEPGHAWAIYAVEPLEDERADQEYMVRFDCYALVDGSANLVVTHRAPRDAWEDERLRGAELRDSITLPLTFRRDGIIIGTTHDWRCNVIYRPWIELAA